MSIWATFALWMHLAQIQMTISMFRQKELIHVFKCGPEESQPEGVCVLEQDVYTTTHYDSVLLSFPQTTKLHHIKPFFMGMFP